MRLKRVLSVILGCVAMMLGICGLHFAGAIAVADAGRIALEPLIAAVGDAFAAQTAAQAALDAAYESLAQAQAGLDATAVEAAQESVKTCERNLKNATKKADNKANELADAQAAALNDDSPLNGWFVTGCAQLRYALLMLGALMAVLALRRSAQGGRGAALTGMVLGAAFAVGGLLLCIFEQRLMSRSDGRLGALIFSACFERRGLILLIGAALFFAALYVHPNLSADKTVCLIFLAPALIAFSLTVLVPFFLGVYYALTDWNGYTVTAFVGLGNFEKVFADASFLHSFYITIRFTLLSVVLVNLVAFLLAMMVTGRVKGKHFYRSGFFVPNLIGGIVLGYIWQFIFNHVIPLVGVGLGIGGLSQSMLASADMAFFALLSVNIWQYAGYVMMIYVAAIQGVPDSVLEAAVVDGANGWTRTVKIVMPMIANALTVCIFLTLVTSFKQFDLNYSLTVGGPATLFMGKAINSTEFLALNIYNTAFSKQQMGIGQAKAVVFFLVLVVVSLLQVWAGKRREVEL